MMARALIWLVAINAVVSIGHGVARADELTMAVGPPGSADAGFGRALRQALEATGRVGRLTLVEGVVPLDRLKNLAAGTAAVAVTRCDLLARTPATLREVEVAAVLSPVRLAVIARGLPAGANITALRSKRIALSPPGSPDAALEWAPLALHGLSTEDVMLTRLEREPAVTAFENAEVDAIVLVDDPASADLARALKVGTVVALEDKVARRESLGNACLRIAKDIPAIETYSLLVARRSVEPSAVEEILEALYRPATGLQVFPPKRSAELVTTPLHAGALSFLERKGALPFPINVYTGVYAYSISELDIAKGTFLFDGYLWFRWRGPHFGDQPFEFTIVNGTIERMEDSPIIHQGEWHRLSRRVTLRLQAKFALHDYPFDQQNLPIELEHRWMGDEKLVFVPDDGAATSGTLRDSFLSSKLEIGDWVIRGVTHQAVQNKYETDFGSIQKGVWAGTSSRYILTIQIRRSIVPYAIKFILPLIVIVLMSFMALFIGTDKFEVQTGIVITALLACVAFHISQANSLPEVGYLVKADKFFIVSYVLIFLTLIKAVASHTLQKTNEKRQRALDRGSRVGFPVVFFATLGWLLISSS
jgi:TRAP-type uncharacterized transport system substrate-binding protein